MDAKIQRLLEPLCAATQSVLKPISWLQNEFILIDTDDEIKRFIVRPVRASASTELSPEDKWFIHPVTGDTLYERGSANMGAMRMLMRRIPEKQELGFGKWRVAGTDFSALVLKHSSQDNLVFLSESAENLFNFLVLRFFAQTSTAIKVANFKANGELPTIPKDYVNHPELPLADYQLSAMLSSVNKESYALFMEQGTGKTAVSVARINLEGSRKRGYNKGMYRALIVCPKQVRRNWENEFERFSTIPGKVSLIAGGRSKRVRSLLDGIREEDDCAWSACVMSVDSVDSTWDSIRIIPWDLVVLDESHYIKNPNSRRFKVMKLFRELNNGNSRMILTGTPVANNLFDLWAQLEFLGEGLSGFMSFKNFKNFHGVFNKSGQGFDVLVGTKGIPLIQERLSRISYIIKKSEANLKLPDKVYDLYEVEMTPKQTKIYSDLATKLATEIEEILESGTNKSVVIEHILTKLLRLAQVTSGHIKWDETLHPEQIDDALNPKAKAVLDMVLEEGRDPNGKTLVWCCFDEDIRIVSDYLHKAGVNHVGYKQQIHPEYRVSSSDEAERKFNCDKNCKVFLANPASGGTGLNLFGYDRNNEDQYETYTDHEIFFSSNWSAVQRSQAEDRAHRRGTRCNVRITDLIVPDTIDEEIRRRVKSKLQAAATIQDIRGILDCLKGMKE